MVPQRLMLRNFLCYRDACEPLDFAGLDLVCLTGENGHGKSALLDAMTWAVWGEARGKNDDDLIHLGCTEMEVQFDFRVASTCYRVVRKRRKATGSGTPGKPLLEFQVQSGDGWKTLSGPTLRETQQRIIEAVRLSYDTFRNSAFLVQGRADEFALKAPGDRKKVLGEILGLDAYDRYERRARDEARHQDAELRRLDTLIAQLDRELAGEAAYERERAETAAELEGVEPDLKAARAVLAQAAEAERTAAALRARAEALTRDLARAQEHITRDEGELAAQQAAIDRQRAVLDRGEEIRVRFAALGAARAADSEQASRLARVMGLRREETAAEKAIEAEAAKLSSRAELLTQEVERLAALRARVQQLEIERAMLDAERRLLAGQDEKLAQRRRAQHNASAESGALKADNDRLRADMDEVARKRDELQQGGVDCPICGTPLGEDGKARIAATYESDGKALAARFRENRAMIDGYRARAATLDGEVHTLEGEAAATRTALDRRAATVERDEAETQKAVEQLPALERDLDATRTLLASNGFVPEQRERLLAVRRQIEATGYDEAAHARAHNDAQRLVGVESEHAALAVAEQALAAAERALARAREDLAEWRAAAWEAEKALTELDEQLRCYAGAQQRLQEVLATATALEERERRLRLALGAAEQRLADCRRYRGQRQVAAAERAAAAQQQQVYDDLTTAFGRKGVQALIIDAALPEIQAEANDLLARMSNGRMHLELSTQRQTQKGQTVETLDIVIGDDIGTRPYELYSGGEAFRINLALRIALSKLLARRAGAPLPTLIVDEGFGTQDMAGRERLMEALATVSRDFKCMIVITHIDELKEYFERRIFVEKTARGSIATVL